MKPPSQAAKELAAALKEDIVAAGLIKEYIPPDILVDLLNLPRRGIVYIDHKDVGMALRHFQPDEVNDYALCLACKHFSLWRLIKAKLQWKLYAES